MKNLLYLTLLLSTTLIAIASPNQQQPLPVDSAFVFSAKPFGEDTVVLTWDIAPKHYLYRERLHFKITQPANAQIGSILSPAGQPKSDAVFGNYEIYTDTLSIPVPIINADPNHTILNISYQGCSEDGYCYPPTARQLEIDFQKSSIAIHDAELAIPSINTNAQDQPFLDLLSSGHVITLLFAFLGFGVLLSLTPCVLPMVPILSGIIVGHEKTALRGKAFRLSLIYVLSMAATYAVAGVLVGWLGGSVQSAFQTPWVIGLFSLLFVLLALSFFGFYALKLPARFEERISNISRHQKSGHYLGVVIMGCLATLIVSPCVTPALVGVLGYISKTGDAILGGAALFMLGLGMGTPLLVIGFAGGKFLPKAGAWMKSIERSFGVLFLGLAIWMLERLIPPSLTLTLWSGLLIICAVYLGGLSATPTQGWGKFRKGVGLVLLIYGFILAVGAAQGNGNPLRPLDFSTPTADTFPSTTSSTTIKSLADLETALAQAKTQHKPVLVDFYADWCIACKVMERTTFKDPAVIAALTNFVMLRADVTANKADEKALMQHFNVIAPPTFLLFDADGNLLPNWTRAGEMSAKEFLDYLSGMITK